MFRERAFEIASVDPSHSKIATTGYWSQGMVDIRVESYARLQRMMCNRGMEVIGDTAPAMQRVMGVNRTTATPSMQFDLDFKETNRWKRRVVLTKEQEAWEAKFKTKSTPHTVPTAGVDTGMKVAIDHSPPELSVFAEMPQYKAIKAAGRLATRLDNAGVPNEPYLNQFEQWWGFPNKFISDRLNKTIYPISIPRLLAAGGKTSSPLYGMENFSGLIRFTGPGVSKEHFEREIDVDAGNIVCVDFAVYRAAAKFATVTTITVPGAGSKAMKDFQGVIGYNLNEAARVVVTPKSRQFLIPELKIEAKPLETLYVRETKKAIKVAQRGRLAVIAGIAVEHGEELISYETRQRMGQVNLRGNMKKNRLTANDVLEEKGSPGADYANAETGILEYCLNMMGGNRDHLINGLHSLGGVWQLVYESASQDEEVKNNRLTLSKEHCKMVATLWSPIFTMDLQRVCRANGQELSSVISSAPANYPYIARVAYILMKSRMGSVLSRVRAIHKIFAANQTIKGKGIKALTIRSAGDILTAWGNYYASKAKNTVVPFVRVRSQILAAFYAQAELSGDIVAFPDIRDFLVSVCEKYTRRRKLPQLNYDPYKTAEDVSCMIDATYPPEVKFSTILVALLKCKALTIEDLVTNEPEVMDAKLIIEESAPEVKGASEEDLAALNAMFGDEGDDPFAELEASVEYHADNKKGPLLMRNKFYSICMTYGSEQDFIKRMYKKSYTTFDSWYASEPNFYDIEVEAKCRKYGELSQEEAVPVSDDPDILSV